MDVRPGRLLALLAAVAWLLLTPLETAAGDPETTVLATRVADAITPVVADHVEDAVEEAERGGHAALLVELDTPGGLVESMRDIVQRFLDADVPVVVYVTPPGARAASAGALITFAAHVAAMAPATTIGAATPVSLGEGEVAGKVVEDAAAFAAAVASERGRDVEFAVATVREGRAVRAERAVEIGAVDLVSGSADELLTAIDGMTVTLGDGREVALATEGAQVERFEMGLLRQILQRLADPNIAFLLLSVGTLGLIYELASPGVGAGGVLGVAMIVLALFSLSVLPINVVGLLFLVLAAALFVAELFAPGIGVFAFLGAGSLLLSGLFLFRDAPGLTISLAVVTPVAAVVGGAVVLAGRLVLRSRRAPATTGAAAFVGRTVTVGRASGDTGQGFVDGAWWQLQADEELHEGQPVRVRDVDELTLLVEPAAPSRPREPEEGGQQ